jgi:hypothetical protein
MIETNFCCSKFEYAWDLKFAIILVDLGWQPRFESATRTMAMQPIHRVWATHPPNSLFASHQPDKQWQQEQEPSLARSLSML